MRFLLLIVSILSLLPGCVLPKPMIYDTGQPIRRNQDTIQGYSAEKAGASINIVSEIALKPMKLQFLGIAIFELNDYVSATLIEPLNELRKFQLGHYNGVFTVDISRDLQDFSLAVEIHF